MHALDRPGFTVVSLACPVVMGWVVGDLVALIEITIRYLIGETGGPGPRVIPPGGSHDMSTISFAETIAGAIEQGEPGAEYLMGDQYLTYQQVYVAFRQSLGLPACEPDREIGRAAGLSPERFPAISCSCYTRAMGIAAPA